MAPLRGRARRDPRIGHPRTHDRASDGAARGCRARGSDAAMTVPARPRFAGDDVAFVTGGASGIGYAVVRQLLGQGVPVAVLDHHVGDLDARLGRERPGARWLAIEADVTDEAAVASAVDRAEAEL